MAKKQKERAKRYISSIILIGVLVFFGFYLKNNISVIINTFDTTLSNITRYFFVAVGLVLISFYFLSKSYQVVFKMNGIFRRAWDLFKLNFVGMVVNVIVPTAGLSQAMIYAEDAERRGDSRAKTVNAVIVTYISDYTSIALFLIFSLIYLKMINSLLPYVVVPAAIFILITIGAYLLAFLAGRESKNLEKILIYVTKKLEKMIRKISTKRINVSGKIDKLYTEFKDVNKAIIEDPKDWLLAIFYACIYHLFAVFALYFIFVSLGVNPLLRVLIAGYSVGAAFVVVSPTPNGIGFVEGGMYLVFSSLGIPPTIATTAVIIYRGLTFWIPLFFGFIIYQRRKIRDLFEDSEQNTF